MTSKLQSLAAAALVTLTTVFAFANNNTRHPYLAYVDEGYSVKRCLKEMALIPDVEVTEVFEKNGIFKVSSTRDGIHQVRELECIGGAEAAQYPAHW